MASEGFTTKFLRGKEEGIVDVNKVRLPAQVQTVASATRVRPRFDSHTQSSLLKRRKPVLPRRRSPTSASAGALKRLERNVVLPSRLSGISKNRDRNAKQSKSMHALKTIIKREKNRQSFDSLQSDSEQTIRRYERRIGSLVFLHQIDFIKDISRNLKKYAESSTELVSLQDDVIETVDRFYERRIDMHASHQDDQKHVSIQQSIDNSARDDRSISKNCHVTEASHKVQTNDDNDKNSRCNVEILHRRTKRMELGERSQSVSLDMNRSTETQIQIRAKPTNVDNLRIHKQEMKMNRNAAVRTEDAVGRNLRGLQKRVDYTRGKNIQPPMPNKTVSCQKNQASQKKGPCSAKCVGSLDSGSTNISKQTKMSMKENRNPCIDPCITGICKQFVETKQNGGALPKKRRSLTKIVCFPSSNLPKNSKSKILSKCDGADSIKSRSRSRSRSNSKSLYHRKRSITPKKFPKIQKNDDYCCKRKSKRVDAINASKENFNGRDYKHIMEKNIDVSKSKTSVHEANDREMLRTNDISLKKTNNEINFMKTENSDETNQSFDQSSWKSVGIQTDLDLSLFLRNDSEVDVKRIPRSSETVGTQTSPQNNKNVKEIGCNTMPYKFYCKDTGISCDLINWTNLKTDIITIEDKSITENAIHAMISTKCDGADAESENFHENKKLTNECKETKNKEILNSSFEEITEYFENDEYNEMIVPELNIENISSSLIAAFQLTAERVRNLYEAVILYKKILISRESEQENKEPIEYSQTSVSNSQCCIKDDAFFENYENKNEIISEYDTKCHFIMRRNEDFDVLSACSSNSNDSNRIYESEVEFEQSSKLHQTVIDQVEMNTALPREEEAIPKSVLNERINFVLANVKSSLQLLVHHTLDRYASEVLETERLADDDGRLFKPEKRTIKTSMLSAIRDIKIFAQEFSLSLVCCVLFLILVYWYLLSLFTFNCVDLR